jgi:tetratricopeptide (TPR) repeat protein
MEFKEYQNRAEHGAILLERGNTAGALEIFQALVYSDISDLDKAMMCGNMAMIYTKINNPKEALAWYDKGIALERPHGRYQMIEYKAGYLNQLGRPRDALRVLESIIPTGHATEAEKVRLGEMINNLRKIVNEPVYRRPGQP